MEFQIGQQQIHAQGRHYLRHHCVLTGTEKSFDLEVLFYPFEEQFNLPPLPVNIGNGFC